MPIDTMNKFFVAAQGERIAIMRTPGQMSADDALMLAAYLVSMAEPMASNAFEDVLAAVQNA